MELYALLDMNHKFPQTINELFITLNVMGQNSLVACTASMHWYKVLVACTSQHDVLGEIVNATLITMMRVIPPREFSSFEYPQGKL